MQVNKDKNKQIVPYTIDYFVKRSIMRRMKLEAELDDTDA
jgi:hypothetical protein